MVLECFHNKPPIFEVLYNPYLMFKLGMVSSCFTMLSVPFKPCRTGGISLVPWDVDVVIPPFYEAPIPDKIIVGHRYIHHIHISHIVRIYIHTHTSHIYIYIYTYIYTYNYIYTHFHRFTKKQLRRFTQNPHFFVRSSILISTLKYRRTGAMAGSRAGRRA